MNIKINVLSQTSIDNALKQVTNYKTDLDNKLKIFVSTLADDGIFVARNHSQFMENTASEPREYVGGMVMFSKQVSIPNNNMCTAILVGADTNKLIRSWSNREEEVSPLLMMEFGSGTLAKSRGYVGVGQGTFPNAKPSNYNNPDGWYWRDNDGNLHHTKGVMPSTPMYHAYLSMLTSIETIGKQVFRS